MIVRRKGQPQLERWFSSPRLEATLLGPSWRFSFTVVIVVGGLGGIWPVGVLGHPGLGLCAGFVNGSGAAAAISLLWLAPVAFLCLGADAAVGLQAIQISQGYPPEALRTRAWARLWGLAVAAAIVGGCSGAAAGLVTNVSASARFSLGMAGADGSRQLGLASIAFLAAVVLSGSIAELFPDQRTCLVAIYGTQLITLVVISSVALAPALAFAQFASPWIGIWPLRASATLSPLFGSKVSYLSGFIGLAVWILAVRLLVSIRLSRGPALPSSVQRLA